MRIVVIGCGGIGGTLAASLLRAGADVTPVTGNAVIARALTDNGFLVDDFQGGSWSVPARAAPLVALADGPPPEARKFDLCIVATQSTTLEPALAAARPWLADDAIVMCCQNGLPEERAARIVGAERVLGCVVGWGASMVAPGHYQRTSRGVLSLGRPSPRSPDPAAVAPLLEAASPVLIAPDLAAVRWSKLAINCVTTTIGATGGDRLGALLKHRFARRVALEIFAEVAAVAQKSGVRPAPLAGTLDIEKVAITAEERALRLGSPALLYKHSILLAVGFKYRRMRSSMLYALERGRPPEIDHLNGEVARRGAALGVPVPVNQALVAAVRRIVAEQGQGGGARPSLALLRSVYEEAVVGRGRAGDTAAA